jgi:hypothetical protein
MLEEPLVFGSHDGMEKVFWQFCNRNNGATLSEELSQDTTVSVVDSAYLPKLIVKGWSVDNWRKALSPDLVEDVEANGYQESPNDPCDQ